MWQLWVETSPHCLSRGFFHSLYWLRLEGAELWTATLHLIETIDRLNISNIKELLEYRETLPNHNRKFTVDGIEEVLEDPSAVQLVCAHLLLKKMEG